MIVWTMCRCYVWPNYEEHIEAGEFQGYCGRCGGPARLLSWANDKREARELFFLEYEHYPRPIVS